MPTSIIAMLCLFVPAAYAMPVSEAPWNLNLIREYESHSHTRRLSLDADSLHSYDVIALSLDYRIEADPVPLTGYAYLTLVGREVQEEIRLSAEDMQIVRVNEWDAALPFVHVNDTLIVTRYLGVGDTVTLEIEVSVPPQPEGRALGYQVRPNHVFTHAEPYGARRWFPCFDQPFDKINELTVAMNMPENYWLASNGECVETTYPSAGRKRQVYTHNHPIATYLIMICAGEFTRRYETVDGVEYRYFTFSEDSANAVFDWSRTPEMTALFEGLFGEYPFEQYGMVQAEIFDGNGAMEHQTFTTYGSNLVTGDRRYEDIVAHELAHMWFGDDLTPVDFRNIWLKEGFATYAEALYAQHFHGQVQFERVLWAMATWYFIEDAYLRYAAYDPPEGFLFGTVEYEKSAWILHMLRTQLLGDSLFSAALHTYTGTFSGGSVNTEDFIGVVNATAGEDVRWFFDQWIYQAGHPELAITIQAGVPAARDVSVTVVQTQTNAPIFRFPLSMDITTVEGTTAHLFWFDQRTQTVVQSFPADVQSAELTFFQNLLYETSTVASPELPAPKVAHFELLPAYPNPFNSSTRIPFELATTTDIALDVWDVTGRHVATLAQGWFEAGRHEIGFQAKGDMAAGVYFVSLEGSCIRRVQKLLLVK